MTEENKKLLLRDLSSRLPYGVIIIENDVIIEKLQSIDQDAHGYIINPLRTENPADIILSPRLENVRPYLRPMVSMTEEEKEELLTIQSGGSCDSILDDTVATWLDKHMLDWRGLIPLGLAEKAKPGMYQWE